MFILIFWSIQIFFVIDKTSKFFSCLKSTHFWMSCNSLSSRHQFCLNGLKVLDISFISWQQKFRRSMIKPFRWQQKFHREVKNLFLCKLSLYFCFARVFTCHISRYSHKQWLDFQHLLYILQLGLFTLLLIHYMYFKDAMEFPRHHLAQYGGYW